MRQRYHLAILVTILLIVVFTSQLKAQSTVTCVANTLFHERWTRQLTNVNPDVWRFSAIALSPNGAMLAVVTSTSLSIYDSQTLDLLSELEQIRPEEEPYRDYSVSWSPDNRRIVVARYLVPDSDVPNPRNRVQIWDIEDQELKFMLPYETKTAVWSPEGTMIAVAHQFGEISILDSEQHTLNALADIGVEFEGMVWSPSSQQIAISSRSEPPILLSVEHRVIENIGLVPEIDSSYLSWSPNGANLAIASWVGTEILIWNETSEEVVTTLEGAHGNPFDVQWSPDGALLARGTQNGLFLWDMTSDSTTPALTFDENVPPFARIAWLPDSQHLISVDLEGSIYRWNVETGCVEAAVLTDWRPGE